MAENDELLTVDEAAARVRVHPETIRRWIKAERLPAARPAGGPYRIHSTDLDRLFGTSPKVAAPPSSAEMPGVERRDEDEILDDLELEELFDLLEDAEDRRDAIARAIVHKGPFTETQLSEKMRQRRVARREALQHEASAAEAG